MNPVIIDKSSFPSAKLGDPNVVLYFYNVNSDAFTYGYEANKTTHIIKLDKGLTAQEIDVILDEIFFNQLIEYGKVG